MKKIIYISLGLIAAGTASYFFYQWYKKRRGANSIQQHQAPTPINTATVAQQSPTETGQTNR